MATRRRTRPLAPQGDTATYSAFMRDLLAGKIRPTKLLETTVPGRTLEIDVVVDDEQGGSSIVHMVIPTRRLTGIDFDEPD